MTECSRNKKIKQFKKALLYFWAELLLSTKLSSILLLLTGMVKGWDCTYSCSYQSSFITTILFDEGCISVQNCAVSGFSQRHQKAGGSSFFPQLNWNLDCPILGNSWECLAHCGWCTPCYQQILLNIIVIRGKIHNTWCPVKYLKWGVSLAHW